MDLTIQKTFTFVLFILIGVLLKLKFKSKEEITGIKKIILNLALPATIFIALLGIKIDAGLMMLPVLALLLNSILFMVFPYVLPVIGIKKNTPEFRTARLLVPSLAPGLSCFPFVSEFLGETYLANAAMADLGNKIFVLIILYLVAMNWHYRLQSQTEKNNRVKLKSLVLAMISEPVNIFIVIALIFISLGLSMESLPIFISDTLERLSLIMTPLVLLFIGLAVSIRKKQLPKLLSLLLLRAGAVVFLCGVLVVTVGLTSQNTILLLLAFALSACSFWPFAHISVVDAKETKVSKKQRTFHPRFAINILALSFPLSTALILGILSSGSLFSSRPAIFTLSGTLLLFGAIPSIVKAIVRIRKRSAEQKMEWLRFRTTSTESP